MRTQDLIAIAIVILAGCYAVYKIIYPIIVEFTKKASSKSADTGCGSCGTSKTGLCGKFKDPPQP